MRAHKLLQFFERNQTHEPLQTDPTSSQATATSRHRFMRGLRWRSPLRRIRRQFDRLEDRRIIILRLVDAGRNRPRAHQVSRERTHQVRRVGFVAKPAGIITRRQNHRHPVIPRAVRSVLDSTWRWIT